MLQNKSGSDIYWHYSNFDDTIFNKLENNQQVRVKNISTQRTTKYKFNDKPNVINESDQEETEVAKSTSSEGSPSSLDLENDLENSDSDEGNFFLSQIEIFDSSKKKISVIELDNYSQNPLIYELIQNKGEIICRTLNCCFWHCSLL